MTGGAPGGPGDPRAGAPDDGLSGADAPWRQLVSSGHLEYDRVVFFSDAIFAIAITLLAVDFRVPGGTVSAARALRDAEPRMLGFVISFAVIGLFWLSHHWIFRHIDAMDRTLMLINLGFLGTIAFLPYPTELISLTSNQVPALVLYAAWVSLAGLAELGIWLYASRVPGLLTGRIPAWVRRRFAMRILLVPVVFLLSIPVALTEPAVAPYTWLLAWVLGVVLRRMRPL
jgi:uncharacterized membrane protein